MITKDSKYPNAIILSRAEFEEMYGGPCTDDLWSVLTKNYKEMQNEVAEIRVYSDGSSDGKSDSVGGWAFVITLDGVKVHEASGQVQKATNNTMEVLSATMGLECVANNYSQYRNITLISDSQLTLRWATGEYRVKKPHLLPYVIKLRKFFKQLNAKTCWVKGHSGEQYNEECDKLAKAARFEKVMKS